MGLAANLAPDLDAALRQAIDAMIVDLPWAFTGGLVGGASTGVALELLGVPWLDRVWGEETRSESPHTQSSPSGQWRPAR